jgi:hypothetical protein
VGERYEARERVGRRYAVDAEKGERFLSVSKDSNACLAIHLAEHLRHPTDAVLQVRRDQYRAPRRTFEHGRYRQLFQFIYRNLYLRHGAYVHQLTELRPEVGMLDEPRVMLENIVAPEDTNTLGEHNACVYVDNEVGWHDLAMFIRAMESCTLRQSRRRCQTAQLQILRVPRPAESHKAPGSLDLPSIRLSQAFADLRRLLCAARVWMLETERLAEMRKRFAGDETRDIVVAAALLYAGDRQQ